MAQLSSSKEDKARLFIVHLCIITIECFDFAKFDVSEGCRDVWVVVVEDVQLGVLSD